MTRFLQALALRERGVWPVLQPRLPGPFERREPLVEPGGGEPPAGALPSSPQPAIEATPDWVVNEPAQPHPLERHARPGVHDAPVAADALPEVPPVRRSVAASFPALRSGGEAQAAPQSEPESQSADPIEGHHAKRRLESPVQRVAAAPAASPALSERAPMAMLQEDSLSLPRRPEVEPSMLPVWAPQAAAPARGHASARRPDPVRLDAPAASPALSERAPVAVLQEDSLSLPERPEVGPSMLPVWAPQAAAPARGQASARWPDPVRLDAPASARHSPADVAPQRRNAPSAERFIERPAHPRPVQGSQTEPEPSHRMTPFIVHQAQARAAAVEDRASSALPAGPTVHVSIGRVEIRAAAAPAPVAAAGQASRGKAPARAPSLSLNDYLQQRGGVKRSGGGPGSAR